jgi:hypothetical protein
VSNDEEFLKFKIHFCFGLNSFLSKVVPVLEASLESSLDFPVSSQEQYKLVRSLSSQSRVQNQLHIQHEYS